MIEFQRAIADAQLEVANATQALEQAQIRLMRAHQGLAQSMENYNAEQEAAMSPWQRFKRFWRETF